MLPPERPDRIYVAFDDHRLVVNAGLLLPVTLAHHLFRRVGPRAYITAIGQTRRGARSRSQDRLLGRAPSKRTTRQ